MALQTSALRSASGIAQIHRFIMHQISRSLDFLRYALPMSIFFLKFIEWWYASDYHKQKGFQPIPPPPDPIPVSFGSKINWFSLLNAVCYIQTKPHEQGIPLPAESDMCPLCKRERTNSTTIPTGYVFCYPCIFAHVSDNGRCPVTLVPVNVDELRKIYSVT